jgi:hypothetical protein
MKPLYTLLLGVIALLTINTTNASTSLVLPLSTHILPKDKNPLAQISAKQFLKLTPKKYQELTGKKMSFVQKVQLKFVQHKVKRMVKRGEVITMADVAKKFEDDTLMNVLAFLLGVVLGPIGVIIVLILRESGDMSQTAFRWSLIGLLIWLVWFLFWIL